MESMHYQELDIKEQTTKCEASLKKLLKYPNILYFFSWIFLFVCFLASSPLSGVLIFS